MGPLFVERGKLVSTELIGDPSIHQDGQWAAVLRHGAIPFVSYPYEWPFGMLRDAALLQLELVAAALDENMTLKDATAFNVQWDGSQPVFIDIPSFEPLDPGTPWVGYEQFCQMFLYPLMLQAYRGISFHQLLRGRLDGIEPSDCWGMLSRRDLLRPGVLKHVFLQSKVQARFRDREGDIKGELRDAGFGAEMIKANIRGLTKVVGKLDWTPAESGWVNYGRCTHYDDQARQAKGTFVGQALAARHWPMVWDLGCNTGRYSRLAAEHADLVVAMDADHQCVDRLYESQRGEGSRRILPLVANVADPSPALGWRGLERKTLEQRGRPDLVICLALIHHLVIGANIHVDELVGWLADVGADLVIEFVEKSDPMVQRLLQNKDDIYDDYDRANFERVLAASFEVERSETIAGGTRKLFFARNRGRK